MTGYYDSYFVGVREMFIMRLCMCGFAGPGCYPVVTLGSGVLLPMGSTGNEVPA